VVMYIDHRGVAPFGAFRPFDTEDEAKTKLNEFVTQNKGKGFIPAFFTIMKVFVTDGQVVPA
jgi:hypothetical protein